MGIDIAAFEFLLNGRKTLGPFGRTLLLGRQRMLLTRNAKLRARAEQALAAHDPAATLANVDGEYCETLFKYLGAEPLEIMDHSAYDAYALFVEADGVYGERFKCVVSICLANTLQLLQELAGHCARVSVRHKTDMNADIGGAEAALKCAVLENLVAQRRIRKRVKILTRSLEDPSQSVAELDEGVRRE